MKWKLCGNRTRIFVTLWYLQNKPSPYSSDKAIIISHHFAKAVTQGATSYHLCKCLRTDNERDWLPSRLTNHSAYRISSCCISLLRHQTDLIDPFLDFHQQMAYFRSSLTYGNPPLGFLFQTASGCMVRHHLYYHHDLNAAFNYLTFEHTYRASAIFAYVQSLRVWTDPNIRSIPRKPEPINDMLHAPWLGHTHG